MLMGGDLTFVRRCATPISRGSHAWQSRSPEPTFPRLETPPPSTPFGIQQPPLLKQCSLKRINKQRGYKLVYKSVYKLVYKLVKQVPKVPTCWLSRFASKVRALKKEGWRYVQHRPVAILPEMCFDEVE